jgi:hypothetical protein
MKIAGNIRTVAVAVALGLGGLGCNGEIGAGDLEPGAEGTPVPGGGGPGSVRPGAARPPGAPPGSPGSGAPIGPGGIPVGPGGSAGSTGPGDPLSPAGAPSAQVSCLGTTSETTGRRVLRRLTTPELEATVRAAFGLTPADWKGLRLPPDPASLEGFTNNLDRLTVGPDFARGAMESAVEVARLVASPAHLTRLLPCGNGTGQALTMQPCAQQFVTTYGPKLFRRPLTQAEITRYVGLLSIVGRIDFKVFVHWATLTMLQSPRVLYRSELGKPEGGRYRLTPYEVASALSYTYTGGPPDAPLMQAAAANQLSTPEQIEAAARRLVFDGTTIKPAFRAVMSKFAEDWVGLSALSNIEKDRNAFPDYTPEIQDALAEETRQFVSNVLYEQRGSPATLLTAPFTFVDDRLARYYGLGGGGAGAGFSKVARPDGMGVGLLSQGSLLSVESHNLSTSPTKRGYFVRTRLLCGVVPDPPPVVGELPAPTGAETTRQRYETLHALAPACSACHKLFDPIGFAFEHLDATGRYRAKEGRFDIDDSGVLTETSAGDLPFRGPVELATAVSRLPEVSACMASYMAAFAFGVSQSNASCLVRAAADELAGGMSLVDFYVRMSRSEHFRSRLP